MEQGMVKQQLKRIFPFVRCGTGVPPWMVSDSVAYTLLEQAERWLPLISSLGLEDNIKVLEQNTSIGSMSPEALVEESRRYAEENGIRDIFWALEELVVRLHDLCQEQQVEESKKKAARTAAVLAVACFTPKGRPILAKLAESYGCELQLPAEVISRLWEVIEVEDKEKIDEGGKVIDEDLFWRDWLNRLQDLANEIDIPITLPAGKPSEMVVNTLLRMFKEG